MKRSRLLVIGAACLVLLAALTPAQAQPRGGRVGGGINMGPGYPNFGGYGGYGNYGLGNWGAFPGTYGSAYNYGYGYNPYYSGSWGNNVGQVPYLNSQFYPGYNYATPSYNYATPNYNNAAQGYYATPGYNNYVSPIYGSGAGIATAGFAAAGPGSTQQSFYSGPSQRDSNAAAIRVIVPDASAQVWVDGQETRQQGKERLFYSPALEKGWDYTYKVRAAWEENGRKVDREKNVHLRAGQDATVSFAEPQGSDTRQPGAAQSRPNSEQIQAPTPRPQPEKNAPKDLQRDQGPDR